MHKQYFLITDIRNINCRRQFSAQKCSVQFYFATNCWFQLLYTWSSVDYLGELLWNYFCGRMRSHYWSYNSSYILFDSLKQELLKSLLAPFLGLGFFRTQFVSHCKPIAKLICALWSYTAVYSSPQWFYLSKIIKFESSGRHNL